VASVKLGIERVFDTKQQPGLPRSKEVEGRVDTLQKTEKTHE
jgi:hypothetical protein